MGDSIRKGTPPNPPPPAPPRLKERPEIGDGIWLQPYTIKTATGEKTVRGRAIGPHLGVHRCSPTFERETTGFNVTHIPSGLLIVTLAAEIDATRCAEWIRAECPEELLSAPDRDSWKRWPKRIRKPVEAAARRGLWRR